MKCESIKVLNKSYNFLCQSYLVTADTDGFGAGVEAHLCGDNTIQQKWLSAGDSHIFCVKNNTQPQKINGTSSITVEPLGLCSTEDSEAFEDGYLDLPVDFKLRETKVLTELTELDKFKFSYTVGFDLDETPKNLFILSHFFNPNILDNQYKEISVEVSAGSHIVSESEMYVKRWNNKKISVELRLAVNHWARRAKDTKLNTLPYKTVTMNCDHIQQTNQQFPYQMGTDFYDDDNLGIYYPYAHYTRFIRPKNLPGGSQNNKFVLPLEYNRPWFYATGVLQRALCLEGWSLVSPFFESEQGRSILCYLMNRQYGLTEEYDERRNELNAKAKVDGDYFLGFAGLNGTVGIIKYPNVESGNINNTGIYVGGGEVDIKGKIIFEPGEDDVDITVSLCYLNNISQTGLSITVIEESVFEATSDESEWEYEATVSATRIDEVCVILRKSEASSFVAIKAGTFMEVIGVRPYYVPDALESLRNNLDEEYSVLDFLKGLSFQFNLKFKTDFIMKTVGIYTPYDDEWWGEDIIEGFYIENDIKDIESWLEEKSRDVTTPSIDTPRYYKLQYKSTSNKAIDELDLVEDLWSRTVDLGEKFTLEETNTQSNPFFEPLFNRHKPFGRGTSNVLHVPYMDQGSNFGFDFGPTIGICYGLVKHEMDVDINGTPTVSSPQLAYCDHDAPLTDLIPTVSALVTARISEHNNASSELSIPKSNLVYDVNVELETQTPDKTLYDIVYRRWLLEELNNLSIVYLADIDGRRFSEIDFRNYYCFMHMGRQVIARMNKVNDFHYCSDIYTPVTLIPQRQLSSLCGFTSNNPVPTACLNNPTLQSYRDNLNYTFQISGQSSSIIQSVIFEIKELGGQWQVISNISPTSAIYQSDGTQFQVRAIVNYEQSEDSGYCKSLLLGPKSFKPCKKQDIEVKCLQVDVIDNGISTDGILAEVDLTLIEGNFEFISGTVFIDGSTFAQNYPMTVTPTTLTGDNHIVAQTQAIFVIQYSIDGCNFDPLVKTCEPEKTKTDDCDLINLYLTCAFSGGNITFVKNGVVAGNDYDDYIKYRCSTDQGQTYGEWMIWDGTPLSCVDVQARWFMHFCDHVCPMKCSPILTCTRRK